MSDEQHQAVYEKTGFWGKVGCGCLIFCPSTGNWLVPFRSHYVDRGDCWGTWGGAVDEGNTLEQALYKELGEELGVSIETQVTEIREAVIFKSPHFQYHNFIVVVNAEFAPKLNWETSHAEWMSTKDLRSLDNKHFGLEYLVKNLFANKANFEFIASAQGAAKNFVSESRGARHARKPVNDAAQMRSAFLKDLMPLLSGASGDKVVAAYVNGEKDRFRDLFIGVGKAMLANIDDMASEDEESEK